MKARVIVGILVGALGLYLVLLAGKALAFIADGRPVPVALGLAILVLPVLGAWLVYREVAFGRAVAALARELAESGRLPVDDLPRLPSGRVDRAAARARFADYEAAVRAAPEDPAAWFALSVGYDDCGDRRAARAAMRTALNCASATGAAPNPSAIRKSGPSE